MRVLRANDRTFAVEGILFDKDGTLVDLDACWAPAARRWIEVASGREPDLSDALRRELGYDEERRTLVRGSPFSEFTLEALAELTARLLMSRGMAQGEARARAQAARRAAAAAAQEAQVVPIGDVAGALRRLRTAGLVLGIATSDDHAAAERALMALGVRDLVGLIIGGDDSAPPKPDPTLVDWAATRLGTSPARLLVVGDTEVDRRMAVTAAGFVWVDPREGRAVDADAVVRSIDELRVEGA